MRLRRFVCFLIGHKSYLHFGQFFRGMISRNEPIRAWSVCHRCGRLLKFYGGT